MGVTPEQMRTNLLGKARASVGDKSVGSRVWHTKGLHSIRSAVASKGSFGSKASGLALAVGRKALSCIPIPSVALTPIVALTTNLETMVRKSMHRQHVKDGLDMARSPSADIAAEGVSEVVKFQLKDVSVGELDRFRWKLAIAVEDLDKAIRNHSEAAQNAAQGRVCHSYYAVANASMQVERRYNKLVDQLQLIKAVLETAEMWAETARGRAEPVQGYFWRSFDAAMESADLAHHEECGELCCLTPPGVLSGSAAVAKSVVESSVARRGNQILAGMFNPVSYVSISLDSKGKFSTKFYAG